MPGALDEKDHHALNQTSGERLGSNHSPVFQEHATLNRGM